jgi:hypothetical protein
LKRIRDESAISYPISISRRCSYLELFKCLLIVAGIISLQSSDVDVDFLLQMVSALLADGGEDYLQRHPLSLGYSVKERYVGQSDVVEL